MLDHKYQQKKNKVKPKKMYLTKLHLQMLEKKIKLLKNNKKLEH